MVENAHTSVLELKPTFLFPNLKCVIINEANKRLLNYLHIDDGLFPIGLYLNKMKITQ
jgi:hypothetical protein